MNTCARPFLLAVALGAASSSIAIAQTSSLDPSDLPSNASVSGPGPIKASPTRSPAAAAGVHALPSRSSGPAARALVNGTNMSYGQAGANAMGNTGGLTTGPMGSAGAVAGGGGVHSGALVIPPGPTNAAMRSDDARERTVQSKADSVGSADERMNRSKP
ncbi:MAG: hypothetical protein M3Z31_18845 [Pseudomonadota bacterium]|nr:hypothetical protein [Pseudomonadota bacterium]